MALLHFRKVLLLNRLPSLNLYRQTGYIVLIPEIGEDFPEKDTLFQENGLPQFNSITTETCMAAVGKQALDFEKGVRQIEERLKESSKQDVFKDIFQPLDVLGAPLDTTWGLSKTLYLGNNSLMPTKTYLAIHEHAKRARATKFNCSAIYNASKKDLEENKNRTKEELRVIKKFILEGKLNGLELDKQRKVQLEENRNKLIQERNKFKTKVESSTRQFKHTISDYSIVRDFPENLLKSMAVNSSKVLEGPWQVTLDPQVYEPFMKYCPDRDLRFNAWLSMVTRGATHRSKDLVTSTHIEEIRFLRWDQAKMLGYKTFVDMSMETKMVGNVENLKNMMHNLLQIAKPAQEQELNSLYEFAKEKGFNGSRIDIWDVSYWKRKRQRALFNYEDEDFKKYFPLPKVLDGLFRLCENLFGIEIAQRKGVSVWHKDVQFYDVFEKDGKTPIAGFYLDLYKRNDEKLRVPTNNGWMVAIQNRSEVASTKPLAALIYNFQSAPNKPVNLTFREVSSVFHRFGHALQHLLTRTTYSEVAGLSNVEWDIVEMCGYFLSHWLYNRNVIQSVSSSSENGEQLPDDMFEAILEERKHMAGLELCNELYLSDLDIELHSCSDFWLDIVKNLWPKYRSFPLDKLDSHPCSFTQIFSEEWGAAYYSHIWSRVIAADVYSAFHEVRNDEQQLMNVGKRFRDTFLALGGSCNPNEMFRMFRGRDPSHKALLKLLGLRKDVIKEEQ